MSFPRLVFFLPRWKVSFLFTYANHHKEMFRCWCLMDPWGTWSSWKNLEGRERALVMAPCGCFTHCSRTAWKGGHYIHLIYNLVGCVGACPKFPFQWCHILQLPCVTKNYVKLTKFSKSPEACSESDHDPALCPRLSGASPHVAAGQRSCKMITRMAGMMFIEKFYYLEGLGGLKPW